MLEEGQSQHLGSFIKDDVEMHTIELQKRNNELCITDLTEVRTSRKVSYTESFNVTSLEAFEETQRIVADWKKEQLSKLVTFDDITAQVMQNPNFAFLSLENQKQTLKFAQYAYADKAQFAMGLTKISMAFNEVENAEEIKEKTGFKDAIVTVIKRKGVQEHV